MTMLRIVAGAGAATPAAILQLSMQVAGAAIALGLAVVSNRGSRTINSPSRYVTLRDRGGRIWLIRISNHRIPVRNNHPLPHLDLVSIDGSAGLPEASVFLARIADGTAAWFDSTNPMFRRELKRTHRTHRRRK